MKMKFVLIEPNGIKLEDAESGENIGPIRLYHPKASQLAIAAYLKAVMPEIEVEIIDMKDGEEVIPFKEFPYGKKKIKASFLGKPMSELEEKIKDADVVGITSNFTYETNSVMNLLNMIKHVNPRARTLVGGSDASGRPEFYAKHADAVVVGEIEGIDKRELTAIVSGEKSGVIRANKFTDMNQLALPPFELFDLARFRESHEGPLPNYIHPPLLSLETSRGCKHACSYCTTPRLKGKYKAMSISLIEKFLKYYKANGVTVILLDEDNFLSRIHKLNKEERYKKREEILQIMSLLRENNFKWEWSNGLEIGQLWDPYKKEIDGELIESLYGHSGEKQNFVGCYRAYIPLEKLAPTHMRKLQKLRMFDQEKEILKAIASNNIPLVNCGVIIGTPDETESSLQVTEERATEIKKLLESNGQTKTYMNIFASVPLPGSIDYKRFSRIGAIKYSINRFPELWNFSTSVIQGKTFSPEEITKLRIELSDRINGCEAFSYWRKTGKYFWEMK